MYVSNYGAGKSDLCTDGGSALVCTSPSLSHAAGIAPLSLHPLNARSWMQVAGKRAADDRGAESCGERDLGVFT